MAKEVIFFNLKEGISEDEYLEWVKNTKVPAQLGVRSGKRFTMLKTVGAESFDPQKDEQPKQGDAPFKYCVIMEVTSLEEWSSDVEGSKELSENVFPTWMNKYASDFMQVNGIDLYDKKSD